MNGSCDESPQAPSVSREDEEIYCPFCYYNLTGNLSGRCPECGAMFDRTTLLQALHNAARCVMPWDSPERIPLLSRFWQTLRVTWFNPREFVLAFGFIKRRSRATSFALVCLAILVLVVLVCVLVDKRLSEFNYQYVEVTDLWFGFALVLVAYVCLLIVSASVLLTFTVRHRDGVRRLWPWWAILRYSVGHFTLMAAVPATVALLAVLGGFESSLCLGLVGPFALAGCVVLWGLTLARVVSERSAGSRGSGVGVLAILAIIAIVPAWAAASILAGVLRL